MADVRIVSVIGGEIITLAEAKNYLRITNNQDDALITDMIPAARQACERFIEQDIVSKTREMYLPSVDCDFNLYYGPITSVDEVEIDGEVATLDSDYEVLGLDYPVIRILLTNFTSSSSLPREASTNTAEKVKISYTTSGIDDGTVKLGILSYLAFLYYGRDAKMSTNYKSFLSPFKRFGYYGTR